MHEEHDRAEDGSEPGSSAAEAPDPQPEEVPALDAIEARVLGVLVEKGLTTPDQYPLSLNALTNGVNQKSNRNPVLDLEDYDVLEAVQRLRRKGLASVIQLSGSRIDRFRHTAREGLNVETAELAVLAELMMRGPQTAGALRTRASRMIPIPTLDALGDIMRPLDARGLARRVAPAPGSRAMRYAQLIVPDLHPIEEAAAPGPRTEPGAGASAPRAAGALAARVESLEAEVALLRSQLQALAEGLGRELAPAPAEQDGQG